MSPRRTRAYEHRPKAAVLEAPQPDADLIFDPVVAEPDARRRGVPPNLAVRHQGATRTTGKSSIVRFIGRELMPLDTCVYFAVHRLAHSRAFRRAASPLTQKPTSALPLTRRPAPF